MLFLPTFWEINNIVRTEFYYTKDLYAYVDKTTCFACFSDLSIESAHYSISSTRNYAVAI